MTPFKRVAGYVCLAAVAAAQTRIDLRTQGKNPTPSGTVLPAACSVGDLFTKTDSAPGQNLYLCTASNVWSLQGAAYAGVFSAVASLPATCSPGADPQIVYLTAGTPGLYQCVAENTWSPNDTSLIPGNGLMMVCTASSCTLAIDPAWPGVTVTPPGYAATSSTSLTVGTGSRTLTTQAGLAYSTGASVVLTSAASGAWMFGVVTSYSGTTMAVNVTTTAGLGTYADWTINLSANPANPAPLGMPNQVLATDPSGALANTARLRPLVPGDLPAGYPWMNLAGVPATFSPSRHAATHQTGGADEIATLTPAPFAIPKAGNNGKLAQGWIDFTGYQTAIGGAPATWPAIPTISGTAVLKGSGGNAVAASSSDVLSLWSGSCSSTTFLRGDGSCAAAGSGGAAGGTVTSVGLSLPDIFSVSGSPITGTGTLGASLLNQNTNSVWAGPAGGSAAPPGFRALVAADLPAGYNAPTATALAAMPSQCPANSFATGVTATGAANCTNTATGLSIPNSSLGSGYLSTTRIAGTGGVAANLLCKTDSSGNVVPPSPGDAGILGVCISTASNGGTVEVATRGIVQCVADNASTVNDLVIAGTTTAGACRDSGRTSNSQIDMATQVIGVWLDAVGAGSLGTLQLFGPGHYGTQVTGSDLPAPSATARGGVQSQDCTGTGHVLKINTDGSVTCSADAGGAAGVTGPASATVGYLPTWSNTAGTALAAGLPVISGGTTGNSVVQRDSGGGIYGGNGYLNGSLTATYRYATSLLDSATCSSAAASLSPNYNFHRLNLNNQSSCMVSFAGSSPNYMLHTVLLCNGSTTATTALTWNSNIKAGITAGGSTGQCAMQTFYYDPTNTAWYAASPGTAWN